LSLLKDWQKSSKSVELYTVVQLVKPIAQITVTRFYGQRAL